MKIVNPIDERALLIELKSGSQQAFAVLYDQYSKRIYQNSLRLTKQAEIAEELLQDTFFRVWEKRGLIDLDKPFQSYLFRIAANLAYDHFRRVAKDQRLSERLLALVEEHNPIEALIESKENRYLIESSLQSLPPKRREIFKLCKLEGKSYAEVSALLGISESTINDHIVKATKSLRGYFVAANETAFTLLIVYLLSN